MGVGYSLGVIYEEKRLEEGSSVVDTSVWTNGQIVMISISFP